MLLVSSVLLVMSFQVVDTFELFRQPNERDYYHEKMIRYHHQKLTSCRRTAMTIAKSQVDSVLTGQKILINVDSFTLLPKPHRPTKPNWPILKDSIEVEPIFKDSLK